MSTQDPQAPFTEAEISRQSGANANGMSLGVLALARNQGESPESAARFLGRIFAPAWEPLKGKGAFVALQRAALNAVSVGAELHTLSGDERRAEATFGEWPTDGDLEILKPVADVLGLTCQWERRGRELVLVMESPEA